MLMLTSIETTDPLDTRKPNGLESRIPDLVIPAYAFSIFQLVSSPRRTISTYSRFA